jgi:shikimate dehydrogenase
MATVAGGSGAARGHDPADECHTTGLEPVPVTWSTVDPACVVVDVITNPRITPFLATARERGCPVLGGVEMLVQLAMQIFQRWTGVTPEEEVFEGAVADALGE